MSFDYSRVFEELPGVHMQLTGSGVKRPNLFLKLVTSSKIRKVVTIKGVLRCHLAHSTL